MLTRFIKRQLVIFGILTAVALLVLGVYYLRIPSLVGIGQYQLKAELPASGGLYPTSNVTYRGITIGKVTAVEPTEKGAEATMSIDSQFKIPLDASANVHSVSAVGEQYLDLVSEGKAHGFFSPGQTMTKGTVPSEIGPALDTANRGLTVLPTDKISQLLDETAESVGGLGPALQRLVDSTQAIVGDFKTNINQVDDIIQNSAPILDSQSTSRNAIERWAHNLNILGGEAAQTDSHLKSVLSQAAPTADQLNSVFSGVRESLPQTLANLEIVIDMLKRYHKGVEQILVILPEYSSIAQAISAPYEKDRQLALDLSFAINLPPPCLTGFVPASQWRSPADVSLAPVPANALLQDPARHSRQRGAWIAQYPVRRRPRKACCHAEGLPQQQALRAAGHQPVVRRPRSDPELPGPRGALQPGGETGLCDTCAVGQQWHESAARRSATAWRADAAAEK